MTHDLPGLYARHGVVRRTRVVEYSGRDWMTIEDRQVTEMESLRSGQSVPAGPDRAWFVWDLLHGPLGDPSCSASLPRGEGQPNRRARRSRRRLSFVY
jgi:hypothetical protein